MLHIVLEQRDGGFVNVGLVRYARACGVALSADASGDAGGEVPLVGIVFGGLTEGQKGELAAAGLDQVVHIDTTGGISEEAKAATLRQLITEAGVCRLLFSQSVEADILVGKLGIWGEAAAVSKVASVLTCNDQGCVVERSAYTGRAVERRQFGRERFVLSVQANACPEVDQVEQAPPTSPTYSTASLQSAAAVYDLVSTHREQKAVPLPEADVVVSGGRGMKGAEHWTLLEALASTLGAALACSKPVSDMGWRAHHEHVGQTGIKIAPTLYIAVGISGATQHLAGVSGSKVIVVINTDREAPFFEAADYGIVGDAHTIVPLLTAAVQKALA